MSINRFTVVGRLARDPLQRQTAGGSAITLYAVACERHWTDRDGQRRQACDFVFVSSYGRQAEADARFLHKGDAVAVEGGIRTWFDQGSGRGGFRFVAEQVQYLGRPSTADGERDARDAPEQGGAGESMGPEMDAWLADYERAEQGDRAIGMGRAPSPAGR